MRVIELRAAKGASGLRGRPAWVLGVWLVCEAVILSNPLVPSSALRRALLRVFGARIGRRVIIRSRVRVRYPWKLAIGDWTWVGEGVWIDNHDAVTVGANCVLSQETYITTGSHEHTTDMSLTTNPVTIEDGAWLSVRTIVLRGVTIGKSAIITPGSVVRKDIPPGEIHGGNPAKYLGLRFSEE